MTLHYEPFFLLLPQVLKKKSSSSPPFKGFIVQARDASDTPVGQFSASDSAALMECGEGGPGSSVTHKDSGDKEEIELKWRYPEFAAGEDVPVTFYYSVVQVMKCRKKVRT